MAFGPIMKFTTERDDHIELAPFTREEVQTMVPGLQKYSVLHHLGLPAMTLEMESDWYDKKSKEGSSVIWGIWVIDKHQRKLIGSTAINEIGPHVATQVNMRQGITGITITDTEYWGRGIASAAHRARTWYAFRHLGLIRLKSAVAQTNAPSQRALEKAGYVQIFVERNFQFLDGSYVHENLLECLNPADWAWRQWWGMDRPPVKSLEARKRTEAALAWAEKNVTLL